MSNETWLFLGIVRSFVQVPVYMIYLLCYQLKTLDPVGNCQRRVFTVGVSQQMHKITNLKI